MSGTVSLEAFSMVELYLVRHGQDEDNAAGRLNGRRDTPLTQEGEQQSTNAGDVLRRHGLMFAAVYHSPLLRTRQTAAGIVRRINHSLDRVFVLPDLIERDFGFLAGRWREEISELCSDVLRTEEVCYFLSGEGIETFPQVLERAERVIRFVHEMHSGGRVLLVSHGDFILALITAYYQVSWQDVLRTIRLKNADIVVLSHPTGGLHANLLLR